ncbi:hypothetical protein [Cellulomonas sp. Leaf334]|uniref:hypothetical protein n=1 Tax=Cellulomonas sp. Leaf334 TaxID=1736339 RepID=UPI0006F890E1|nr:hypothetical protein [Cellulomonas sp. Leaf334]KQR17331.1 hypothetical protein ASF78_08580 [Cellulomonas sp. Leaf334]
MRSRPGERRTIQQGVGMVFAGDGQVAAAAESALAAIGGVVVATAAIVQGLADGSTTAREQLLRSR